MQAVLTGPETYAADVGAICATQAAQLGELAVPAEGALDQVAAWNTAAAAIMEQAHEELIALDKPPSTDTTAYTSFYGQLIRLVRIAEESAAGGHRRRFHSPRRAGRRVPRGPPSHEQRPGRIGPRGVSGEPPKLN